jgi:hypothetical protein
MIMTWPDCRAGGRRLVVVLLACAGALAGCSGGNVSHNTMTQAQATARARQILRDTAAALTPRPRLGEFEPDPPPNQCLDNIPDAARKVNVGGTSWLHGIAEAEFAAVGRQILDYWKKQGYSIQAARGFSSGRPEINAATRDGFLVSLDWSAKNLLSIGASSPCIYPEGHPPS